MAELIVEPIQTAELEATGYIGTPTGDIELTHNNTTTNVSSFATATVKVPIEDSVSVTPSTIPITVEPRPGYEGLSQVKVSAAPLEKATVTPSTQQQTIVPQAPAIGFSQFTVEPVTPSIDPDIKPENIKQGVDILGVGGTLKPTELIQKTITENGVYNAQDDNADGYSQVNVALAFEQKTVTPSTTQQIITAGYSYQAISQVTVEPTPLESKTVTPTTQQQIITPTTPNIGLSSVTVEAYVPPAPVEEKDVNFYDYDGTLLYSYTFAQALALTELPELPTHEGLTAQEWNWSLANIKLQAQNNWSCDVGALYVSSDGATYLYFDVPKGSRIPELNINLALAKNQTVTIDWGDGTTTEETNSTNSAKAIRATKTDYSFKTDNNPLIVKLIGGLFDLGDSSHWGSSMFTNANGSYMFAPLEKIVFGTNCTGLLAGAFNKVRSSYTFINSKDVKLKDAYVFQNSGITFYVCNSDIFSRSFYNSRLCNIIVSDNIATSIALDYNFRSSLISNIILPFGIKSINQQAFNDCVLLTYIKIPNTVETIGASAFIYCSNLSIVDLTAFTDPSSIPSLSDSKTFSNIYSNAVFYVANQQMLDAFSAATNWSTYAYRFQIKGATP